MKALGSRCYISNVTYLKHIKLPHKLCTYSLFYHTVKTCPNPAITHSHNWQNLPAPNDALVNKRVKRIQT